MLGALPGLSQARRPLRGLTGYGDQVYRCHVGGICRPQTLSGRVTALRFSGTVTTVLGDRPRCGRGSSVAAGGALSPGTGWCPQLAGSRSAESQGPSRMAGQDCPHAELCPRLDSPVGSGWSADRDARAQPLPDPDARAASARDGLQLHSCRLRMSGLSSPQGRSQHLWVW